MTDATITPTDNGPYMVEGPLRVVDADGTRIRTLPADANLGPDTWARGQ